MPMEISFVSTDTKDFDPDTYLKLLVAVAKSDPENGPPEVEYVRTQANKLGLDFVRFWNETPKNFLMEGDSHPSRMTSLVIIKDCIMLATLDGSFSLGEKERIYSYAEKLDLPRSDVDKIQQWLDEYCALKDNWDRIVGMDA